MFVARYSYDPHYDIERGWTAYMVPTAGTKEALADLLIDYGVVKLPPRLADQYWSGDVDAAIEYVLETQDIRYHERAELWMLVHNPRGLSCWPLNAGSIEEAVEEARTLGNAGAIEWGNFGWTTTGNVRYVASVNSMLHIFECEDAQKENDM
jgi:hypothetical protein